MSFYEDRRDSFVYPAIKKRGMRMTLLSSTDTFDEVTGEVLEDSSPKKTSVYGLILNQKSTESGIGAEYETGYAKRIKKEIMMTGAAGLVVSPEMTLLIGSVEHEILSIEPFAPGGVDLFYMVEAVV